ncbi:MAG: HAD family hydrolase [Phycisphaerales bacterium]
MISTTRSSIRRSAPDRLWTRTAEHFADRAGVDAVSFDKQMKLSREWFWSDPERNRVGRLDLDKARAGCVEHALRELNASDTTLAAEIADWFTQRRITAMQPFDGAIDAIKTLKKAGVKLALISNGKGETQREKVVRFELEPLFDCIVLEGEFGAGKPDRRVFDHALNELGVHATETWMVGDNLHWEVAAPQALGMKGIWLDWRGAGLPDDTEIVPDRIIRSIAELID